MNQDAWPSPDAPSGPLPRIEDLPIAEQGYEQEAVRLAFDSFYRHSAQLDASLRALEAVEVFRRDADALRNDLRALRELGLGGLPEPSWPSLRYESPPREVPTVVLRLAFEAGLIVAVAVVAAVAHFRPIVVVGLMAGAFVIVALSEWLGSRSRFVSPAGGFGPAPAAPEIEAAPAAAPLAPSPPVWPAPVPSREPEALTMVGSVDEAREAAAPAGEPEPSVEETDERPAPMQDAEPEEPVLDQAEDEAPAAADVEAEAPAAAEADEEPPEADAEDEPAAADEPPATHEDEEPPAEEHDDHDEDEPALDPWEQHLAGDSAGEEPELAERAGFFRRRRR